MTIHEILQHHWGFYHFRPLQEDIINSVLSGKDTLALLPTGGGKSICFQIPALAMEGLCIVVTPLIALMKDQVLNLKKRNIQAVAIFSGMSSREIDITLDNCVYGNIKFLYVSPERLVTEMFRVRLQKMKVNMLVVDEAHCISQWGYDFRPPYIRIAEIRNLLPPAVPVLALTATATPDVVEDIQQKLLFRSKNIFSKSFERKNIAYAVLYENDKIGKMKEIFSKVKGTGIVYVRNRKHTKEIAQLLNQVGINADYYHAGLTQSERNKKQEDWLSDKTRVIVCTNAFGMGIDKPDVRVVVHISLPESIEAYFQEAGRAGRDEHKSYAVLIYSPNDGKQLLNQFSKKYPAIPVVQQIYEALCMYWQLPIGSGLGKSFDFDITQFSTQYNFDITTVHYALRMLEQAEYLTVSDAVYLPSRVMFTIGKEELYRFEVANQYFEPIIKFLLRTYAGIATNFTGITEQEIATSLQTDVVTVKKMLQQLMLQHVLVYQPQSNAPQVFFVKARAKSENLIFHLPVIQQQKDADEKRINAMIHYAESRLHCRSELLLSYFHDTHIQPCHHCDYCTKRHELKIAEKDFLPVKKTIEQHLRHKDFSFEQLNQLLPQTKYDVLLSVVNWMMKENLLSKNGEQFHAQF